MSVAKDVYSEYFITSEELETHSLRSACSTNRSAISYLWHYLVLLANINQMTVG